MKTRQTSDNWERASGQGWQSSQGEGRFQIVPKTQEGLNLDVLKEEEKGS